MSPSRPISHPARQEIPAEYREVYKDANELFSKLFAGTMQFNIGLKIHYDTNILNKPSSSGMVTSDWHGPDTLVYTAGSRIPSRLYHHSRSLGNWWVLLFAGRSPTTRLKLEEAILQLLKILNHLPHGLVKSLTLVADAYNEATAVFNVPHAEDILYDAHVSARTAYGVSAEVGAIILLRSDGTLAFATSLESAGEVGPYFEAFTN